MDQRKIPEWAKPNGGGLFVVDLFLALGYERDKFDTWAVGQKVGAVWVEETGRLPYLLRHQKTNGAGSHPMAVYPPEWRDKVETLIRAIARAEARQRVFAL